MQQRIYPGKRSNPAAVNTVKLEMVDASASDYSTGTHRHHAPALAAAVKTAPLPDPDSVSSASPVYLFLKRFCDICASLLLLFFAFPFLLVFAIWIGVESPGPVLYRRRVLAQQDWDGNEAHLRTFHAYKLRTMITNAEEYLLKHPELFVAYQKDWKLQNDPRVTKLGAFLRSSSIDELPQLINVLKGEMSLIGPRMITIPELSRYGTDSHRLLGVKPGLTGLWQVSGRQEVSYEERVRLDMIYAETRSLKVDFQIFLKTIRCVLLRQGAY